jgi:hypothetical protein
MSKNGILMVDFNIEKHSLKRLKFLLGFWGCISK